MYSSVSKWDLQMAFGMISAKAMIEANKLVCAAIVQQQPTDAAMSS